MAQANQTNHQPPEELQWSAERSALRDRFLLWDVASIFLAIWMFMIVLLLLVAVAGGKTHNLLVNIAATTVACLATAGFAVLMAGLFKRRLQYSYRLAAFGAQSREEPAGADLKGPLGGVLTGNADQAGKLGAAFGQLLGGSKKKERVRALQWAQINRVNLHPERLTINLAARRWPFQPLRVFCQSREEYQAALDYIRDRRPGARYKES